jgi:hypothetical protein
MPDNEKYYTESTNLDLNFKIFAEELCEVAIQPFSGDDDAFSGGALTVGIFGSWGSGKTALMREVERQIKDKRTELRNYKAVWFNPWKYDGKEDLRNALIQTILRTMASDVREDSNQRKKWFALAKRFGQVSTEISMKIVDSAVEGSTGLSPRDLFEDCRSIISIDDAIDPYLFINNFEEGFKASVNSYVGKQGKLIIFVDDLDRCLPEHALMVLESIKLYLDQPNCVFFLGIDKRSIEYAVRERYKSSMSITGQEYIEKIIRLSFFLPEKSPERVTKILQDSISADFCHHRDNEKLWDLIQCATNSNIRKVKQFIVAFRLIRDIAKGINAKHPDYRIDEDDFACLAKILLLQLNFPDFFDALLKNDALLKKFEHIFLEEGELYKIKQHLHKDVDGQKFMADDHLLRFLVNSRNYPSGFSEPDQIRTSLRLLSITGGR